MSIYLNVNPLGNEGDDEDINIDIKHQPPPAGDVDIKVEEQAIVDVPPGVSTISVIEDAVEKLTGSRKIDGVKIEYEFQRKGDKADSPVIWDTYSDPKNPRNDYYRFQSTWTVTTPDGKTSKFRQWVYTNTRVGKNVSDANFAHREKYLGMMSANTYCRTIQLAFTPTDRSYQALQERMHILRDQKIFRIEFISSTMANFGRADETVEEGIDPASNPIRHAQVRFGDKKGKYLSVDFEQRIVRASGNKWESINLLDADRTDFVRGPKKGALESWALGSTTFISEEEVRESKARVSTKLDFLQQLHMVGSEDDEEMRRNLMDALFVPENYHPGGRILRGHDPFGDEKEQKAFLKKRLEQSLEVTSDQDWTISPVEYQKHALSQAEANSQAAQKHAENLTGLLYDNNVPIGVTNFAQARPCRAKLTKLVDELNKGVVQLEALAENKSIPPKQRADFRKNIAARISQLEDIQSEYNKMVECWKKHEHFLKQYDAISSILSSKERDSKAPFRMPALARGVIRMADAMNALGTRYGPDSIARNRNVKSMTERLGPLRKKIIEGREEPSKVEIVTKSTRKKMGPSNNIRI